nr:hypothetical protein [Tanacetum cinerariifolium]
MDTKSELEEAPLEIEECQPLVSRAPLTDKEFEVSEPSGTRITLSHSLTSSDSTTPLSPDHPLTQTSSTPTPTRVLFHCRTARMAVRTQPTLSLGMSAHIAEEAALSPSSFRKRYRSSYVTSSSPPSALPIRKRSTDYVATGVVNSEAMGDETAKDDGETGMEPDDHLGDGGV